MLNDFATPSEIGIQVGGAGELDMGLEGDDTRTSMFQKDMVPTTPQRQIVPYNVYDPRAGIPGTPQPAVQSQLNIDALIREMNTVFGNPGQTENIGVEENITLMFDHFESMNEDINTDFVLSFFGLIMKLGPIAEWGLNMNKKTILVNTDSFQTNREGIFAVGDICSYPGKLKLILSGFHEVSLASVECFKRARPNEKYRFEFTTSSKTIQNRLGKK